MCVHKAYIDYCLAMVLKYHLLFTAVTIGFGELDRQVPESSGTATIDVTKSGPNMNDIVVLVSPLTYSEFAAMNRSLPSDFVNITMLDPAECKCMHG